MAERAIGNAPAFIGMPVVAGPVDGQVLADSGSVAYSGTCVCNVILGATVSAQWTIARRNVGNTADIANYTFTVLTGTNASSEFVFAMKLEPGERIVVRNRGGNAGDNFIAFNLEQYA